MSCSIGATSSLTPVNYDIFGSQQIRVITNEICWFYEMPDVGADEFMVLAGNEKVGTRRLGSSFEICMRGRTNGNVPVLGLRCTNHHTNIQKVLSDLKEEMIKEGCRKNTIETFVIGGRPPSQEHPEGNIQEENEVLALKEKENIRGTLFNLAERQEETLSVVLTPEMIYVSKRGLYDPPDYSDNAGIQ